MCLQRALQHVEAVEAHDKLLDVVALGELPQQAARRRYGLRVRRALLHRRQHDPHAVVVAHLRARGDARGCGYAVRHRCARIDWRRHRKGRHLFADLVARAELLQRRDDTCELVRPLRRLPQHRDEHRHGVEVESEHARVHEGLARGRPVVVVRNERLQGREERDLCGQGRAAIRHHAQHVARVRRVHELALALLAARGRGGAHVGDALGDVPAGRALLQNADGDVRPVTLDGVPRGLERTRSLHYVALRVGARAISHGRVTRG